MVLSRYAWDTVVNLLASDNADASQESQPLAKSVSEENKFVEKMVKEGTYASAILVINELKRALENPLTQRYLGSGIVKYIAAVGALAFAGKDIDSDGIALLLRAVGTIPEQSLLEGVSQLRFKNHILYINAAFYIHLLGNELTIEALLKVIRAMEAPPDANLGNYVVRYYKDYLSGKYTAETLLKDEIPQMSLFRNWAGSIFDLSDVMTEFVAKELERLLDSSELKGKDRSELLPYFGALGILAFTGREMRMEDVEALLLAVDVRPSRQILNLIISLRFRNHLLYVVSMYYLVAIGIDPNLDYMIKVVRAMGTPPDAAVAQNVIEYYKLRLLLKKVNPAT